MIKWKVYKTTKNVKKAIHNLMDFYCWAKAVKYLEIKVKGLKYAEWNKQRESYDKVLAERLSILDDDTTYVMERRR